MRISTPAFFQRLDAVYAGRTYFTLVKARLLVALSLLFLLWLPINVVKLTLVAPPFFFHRLGLNAALAVVAVLTMHWVRRGHLERAGNAMALGFLLPAHIVVLTASHYVEPLATAIQLFAIDLVFLLLALIFSARWVASILVVIVFATHVWFHLHTLQQEPIAGTLTYAAATLLRDGLFTIGFMFCVGITLVIMIEAAHRRSEEALRETRRTNENLERLVDERTHDLAAATQRAQDSARAKSEFLANMSHEIRTPLHGIIASADLLRRRPDLSPAAAEHVRLISESGDLLLHLLGDILDFSKIEAGQLELEHQSFPLRTTVNDATSLLAPKAAAGDVRLDVTLASDLPAHVVGDSHRLRQVLLNLTANAIKFTPPGGHVEIVVSLARAAAPDPARVRFEVRDTGIGMDAATVQRVFERFTQADSSTTRRYGGSGLGLAISSHLVRLMGGKLETRSAPSEGSTFFFTLELPRAAAVTAPPPESASIGELGIHVLVVEDNLVNRRILAAQLAQLGCRLTEAHNGEEALERLACAPLPDVILMDCHMPRLDGWQTTRRLRGWAAESDPHHQRASTLPVIALTAAALHDERQRCLDAGMNDFVAKPVKLPDLRAILVRFAPTPAAAVVS